MKISYDPEIDALYIRLREGRHECRTVRLSEEVALNIGPAKIPAVTLEGIESVTGPLVLHERPAKYGKK
jgi:uncharacterized protein YuzE